MDIQCPERAASRSCLGEETVGPRPAVESGLLPGTDIAPAGGVLLHGPAGRVDQTEVTGQTDPGMAPAGDLTVGARSTAEDQDAGDPAQPLEAPQTEGVETALETVPETAPGTDLVILQREGSVQLRDIDETEVAARGAMATPELGTEGATGPSRAVPRPGPRGAA